jgi:hypothetical protein
MRMSNKDRRVGERLPSSFGSKRCELFSFKPDQYRTTCHSNKADHSSDADRDGVVGGTCRSIAAVVAESHSRCIARFGHQSVCDDPGCRQFCDARVLQATASSRVNKYQSSG